ncbi:MAG: hypothetical protein EB015_05945 [Methylocystaceae bacterium]|nr:hypothetical protein [Methylocystaceae bacterium]
MPTIITATQLRSVLGVSSSLYDDTYLNDVIDTAEAVVLPMLNTYSVPIDAVSLTDNVAYFSTPKQNVFTEGQSVVITGCGSPFNGTHTITTALLNDVAFSVSITNADVISKNVIPSGLATLSGAATYVGNSAVESAIYAVSVEVFQSRTAAGGQIEGVDFTPSPFRLGRSLFNRVSGLLGPCLDVETMVQ